MHAACVPVNDRLFWRAAAAGNTGNVVPELRKLHADTVPYVADKRADSPCHITWPFVPTATLITIKRNDANASYAFWRFCIAQHQMHAANSGLPRLWTEMWAVWQTEFIPSNTLLLSCRLLSFMIYTPNYPCGLLLSSYVVASPSLDEFAAGVKRVYVMMPQPQRIFNRCWRKL